MIQPAPIYGLLAEFSGSQEILAAARRAHALGYRQMEAYTPFPVEGLAENLGRKPPLVPLLVLLGAICGGIGGYFMEWYAMAVSYPLNIGGRPYNSWPAFIPITFELTILGGALTALGAVFFLNRLPELHHPIFNAPRFERASTDKFFLCIEATDPRFHLQRTRQFLQTLSPEAITEVSI